MEENKPLFASNNTHELLFKCFVLSGLSASMAIAKRERSVSVLRETLFPVEFRVTTGTETVKVFVEFPTPVRLALANQIINHYLNWFTRESSDQCSVSVVGTATIALMVFTVPCGSIMRLSRQFDPGISTFVSRLIKAVKCMRVQKRHGVMFDVNYPDDAEPVFNTETIDWLMVSNGLQYKAKELARNKAPIGWRVSLSLL